MLIRCSCLKYLVHTTACANVSAAAAATAGAHTCGLIGARAHEDNDDGGLVLLCGAAVWWMLAVGWKVVRGPIGQGAVVGQLMSGGFFVWNTEHSSHSKKIIAQSTNRGA